jgi:hypothetical protein
MNELRAFSEENKSLNQNPKNNGNNITGKNLPPKLFKKPSGDKNYSSQGGSHTSNY